MPKQTIEAFFRYPPEQVWRVVTDPTGWVWPGGPEWIHSSRDGRMIVTEDADGMKTVFRIAAFAPPRWYALELENLKAAGRCEALFFRERGGARVEFTADLEGKTPVQKMLLRLRLRQWQERYIAQLRSILR